MVYTLLLSFIVIYLYVVRVKPKNVWEFALYFLPVGGMLTMVLGLQEGVGTDYFSYYRIAEGLGSVGWMVNRNEVLFIYLIDFVKKLGSPQLLFVLVGTIQVTFLMLITYEIKKLELKLNDFFFLYFALSLVFFNQFNGIRQYIAVYIIVYALLQLILHEKKFLFVSLVGIASLFHSSAIFFLVFLVLHKLKNLAWPFRRILLALGVLLVIVILDPTKYIELLLSYTKYRNYIGSSFFRRMSFMGIITKIPKLLVVLFVSFYLEKDELSAEERRLMNLGYMACGVMIMSFSSFVIWRFYQYVDLFITFPVLLFFDRKEHGKIKIFIALALLVMLVFKIVLFPRGEYLYNSILLPTKEPVIW